MSRFLLVLLIAGCASRPISVPVPTLTETVTLENLEVPNLETQENVKRYSAFVVGFNKAKKLSDWVGYYLTPERLSERVKSPRRNYRKDVTIKASLNKGDFPPMPLEKGHLAPRADFAWSEEAQKEADFTTNLAPQMDCVNEEVWKTIEFRIRRYARSWPKTFVITGPVLKEDCRETIKGVCVPAKFFKVALFTSPTEYRTTAFVVPNECPSKVDPKEYLTSVKEVEALTGFDFFATLPDSLETVVEAAQWEPEVPTDKLLARKAGRPTSKNR